MSFGFYQQEDDSEDAIRLITRWIVDIIVVIVLAMFLVQYMGMRYEVIGHSMEPAFKVEDHVLVDQIAYKIGRPRRFDVVVFKNKGKEDQIYMKRVIGLPGEKVQIQNGSVYIDDELLDMGEAAEIINLPGIADNPVVLETGEYFVIGDNSDSSEDSRFSNIGNVRKSDMIGKVWFRFYPFDRIGLIVRKR
ncbi:MAG: signal peptidase I [Lachnospiraceae bacterium]|nr:signal peptidase I [Lachnospiraceae bacterium]